MVHQSLQFFKTFKTFKNGQRLENGQRLDVEFKMAVTLWTATNWDNGRAGELKIYKGMYI